jgi:hypothetical protein
MVDGFFRKVKDALTGDDQYQRDTDDYPQAPPASQDPYSDLEDPYGGGTYSNDPGQFGNVRPASEDPYGDPADGNDYGQFGNVRPASEDPYGDPADGNDYGQFGDVRPASEDPYGDPADQENY